MQRSLVHAQRTAARALAFGLRTTSAFENLQLRAMSAGTSKPESRPPVPDFTFETATIKVRAAEDARNSRDPKRVAQAYMVDSAWRNRSEFVNGRDEIEAFLARKWANESEYRLIKELFAFHGNRIAVRFAYEWTDGKQWWRSYGNENWVFDDLGYMAERYACINDVASRRASASSTGRQDAAPLTTRVSVSLGCEVNLHETVPIVLVGFD